VKKNQFKKFGLLRQFSKIRPNNRPLGKNLVTLKKDAKQGRQGSSRLI
jgi:hypothetical protein